MLLKTIPLEARIENQPYGIAGILYHGTEIYESWTTLLLNPTITDKYVGPLTAVLRFNRMLFVIVRFSCLV